MKKEVIILSLTFLLSLILIISFISASTVTQTVTVTVLPQIDFNIISPIHEKIYNHNRIEFKINSTYNIKSIEYVDVYEVDRKFKQICWTKCEDFSKFFVLSQGEHKILFRAVDSEGRVALKEIEFFIDSKLPKVSPIEEEFTNGTFFLSFREENPFSLLLHYENNTKNISLSSCIKERTKTNCKISLDLSAYNGQKIEYFFNLTDIAGNSNVVEKEEIEVDTSSPVINELSYNIENRRVEFKINVTEKNFKEIT